MHTDHLGSVVAESNSAGQITKRFHYKPFGETLETQQDDVGYTGHKHDSDLGLTYMQARYYDPVLGRFYGNDPIGFRDVHSFNRYAYANNNPYKYIDPTGETPLLLLPLLGGGGAATVTTAGAVTTTAAVTFTATEIAVGVAVGTTLAASAIAVKNEAAETSESPEIKPSEVAGQTPEKIDEIAKGKGLIPKGPNPQAGQGSYTDPATGKQRILVHPDADCGPHCHVNDKDGNRLDEEGNQVPPESPEAHLPLGDRSMLLIRGVYNYA